jgi:outer membrane receptor protein involved in Fe transport
VGSDFIAKQAQDNVFNAIVQLPSLMGSSGSQTNTNGTSGGTNGLASFNLFGLGTIRTLTLIDGQRVVPANVTGVTDISGFPQMLLERVDVVTGGASASWGSDAVAGVVNFITDKKFEGFKANLQGGISTYGDNAGGTFQMAAGTSFLGGRGHAEIAGEFSHQDGVGPGLQLGCCSNALANGRSWFTQPTILQYSIAGTPAGKPQYVTAGNVQDFQVAKYGIITNGPLQGTTFGANSVPSPFQYGTGPTGIQGVPDRNVAGTVSNCLSPFCIGGDNSGDVGSGVTLATPLTRGDVYGRLSYDLTPTTNVYATINWSQVGTSNIPNPTEWKVANLNIRCDNAFLPAAISAVCPADYPAATYPGGFQFGSDVGNLGPQTVYTNRDQRRYVLGVDGAFSLFDKDWTWNSYYQHGENDTSITVRNIILNPYFNAAIDAVAGPNGTIVCRSAAAQAEGCVPFNPFGNITPTQAQKNWVYGGTHGPGPYQITHQKQDAFSISANGEPLMGWAGPISIATGFEYRQEGYNVVGDDVGNGGNTDPLLNQTQGNNWYAGNFHNGKGSYSVMEGFVEAVVPLVNSTDWGKADLDVAGRATGYSTSGYVQTWKAGVSWDTPLDGVRLRALQSRDVRAPNLSELFAAPTTANGTVTNLFTNTQAQVLTVTTGNTLLKPEKSANTQVGVVFQPSWLPGFSASVDYYRIGVKGQISSISQQNVVNLCFQGFNASCAGIITSNGGAPQTSPFSQVLSQAFNIASTITDGVNYESSYQFTLNDWNVPGDFAIRLLATNVMKFLSDTGIPGNIPIESAGTNSGASGGGSGATPHWKFFGMQSYNADKWNFSVTETWISPGVLNRTFIQCTTACPLPTVNNPTISNNAVAGAFYLGVGGGYNITDNWQAFFKIDNITDKAPPPIYQNALNPTTAGANSLLYDDIGRMFHVGVRVNY